MLKEKYQDVEYQYKDKRYPFLCDFYIPKFDLFIELNAFWTHGKHPFDENNKNDLERLNKLKSKSGKFYKLAIQVWTGENPNLASDPKKRLTAKENNLNFLELWDLDNNKNMKIIEDKIKKLNRNQETEL